MKTFTSLITIVFAALIATPSFAQTSGTSPAIGTAPVGAATAPTGQPNPQEMMKQMMEMSKLNENHKLLADMNGSWNYTIKMWMNPDPNAKPQESKGTATRKSAMGGRYFTMDRDKRWERVQRGYDLMTLGVDGARIRTVSYGEERPFDPGHESLDMEALGRLSLQSCRGGQRLSRSGAGVACGDQAEDGREDGDLPRRRGQRSRTARRVRALCRGRRVAGHRDIAREGHDHRVIVRSTCSAAFNPVCAGKRQWDVEAVSAMQLARDRTGNAQR